MTNYSLKSVIRIKLTKRRGKKKVNILFLNSVLKMHTLTACLPSGQTTLTHSALGQLLEIGSGQHDLVKLPAHHLTPPYVDPTENQNVT